MKYKFSRIERYIIWKTHDQACYWCGEPISLKTSSIDHIIPEDLESDIDRIKKEYSLPANFNINDFCNWVPAHNNCNSKKGFELFKPSPVFLAILNDVIKKSINACKDFKTLKDNLKAEKELEKILVLVEEDIITDKEIIEKLGYKVFEDEKVEELGLEIPPGWKVDSVDTRKNVVTVSWGNQSGLTIIPPKDHHNPWWFCNKCGYYGPWNGSQCLTCGHFNDPND